MKTIKQIKSKMEASGIKFDASWLQLGIKQEGGGVKPTGPHTVKILEEPKVIKGKDFQTGQERQELHFLLEEDGAQKKWSFPLYSKDGSPHYLLARLEDVEVGDEITLEMKRKGMKNYIEVNQSDKKEELSSINYEDNKGTASGIEADSDFPDF